MRGIKHIIKILGKALVGMAAGLFVGWLVLFSMIPTLAALSFKSWTIEAAQFFGLNLPKHFTLGLWIGILNAIVPSSVSLLVTRGFSTDFGMIKRNPILHPLSYLIPILAIILAGVICGNAWKNSVIFNMQGPPILHSGNFQAIYFSVVFSSIATAIMFFGRPDDSTHVSPNERELYEGGSVESLDSTRCPRNGRQTE